MEREQLTELLYQAYETEIGGVQVYTTALTCAINVDLKEEWEKYLEQTQNHVEIMEEVLANLGLDPGAELPEGKWFGTSVNRWLRRWKWRDKPEILQQLSW